MNTQIHIPQCQIFERSVCRRVLLSCSLCASRKPRIALGDGDYTSFVVLSCDAHFSHDTPRHAIVDLPFARCPPGGERGSAAPDRRASALPEKTAEIDAGGPPVAGELILRQ
jgi:hypothetical protein